MLKSLENIDSDRAQDVLSAAMATFLPSANPESTLEYAKSYGDLYESVIKEARNKLSIGTQNDTLKANARVLGVLSAELSSILLPPDEAKAVSEKLGNSGELPPGDYTVQVAGGLVRHRKEIVSKELLIKTVQASDALQHLNFDEIFVHRTAMPVSLFWKQFRTDEVTFYILALAVRAGTVLQVIDGYRFYDGMFDTTVEETTDESAEGSLVSILHQLANICGKKFKVSAIVQQDEQDEHVFLYNKKYAVTKQQEDELRKLLSSHDTGLATDDSTSATTVNIVAVSGDQTMCQVLLAYSLSDELYLEFLAKHNPIRPSTNNAKEDSRKRRM